MEGTAAGLGSGGGRSPRSTRMQAATELAVTSRLYPPSKSTASGATGCRSAVKCAKQPGVTWQPPIGSPTDPKPEQISTRLPKSDDVRSDIRIG